MYLVLTGLQKRKSMNEWSDPPAKRPRTQMKTVIRQKPEGTSKTTKSGAKKAKKAKMASRPKKTASSSSPTASGDRRRSGRATKVSGYAERPDSDDEAEMLDGVAEWDYEDGDSSDAGDDAESEADESQEGEGSEQEEEEDEPPPRNNGSKPSAPKAKAKPSPIKASVLAQLQRGSRSTRARGGKPARGASEMDVDEDDDE